MKRNLFFLFLFAAITSVAQPLTLETLRKDYYKVKTDSASCAALYQKVIRSASAENTIVSYRGAIICAMADHSKNKSEKIKLFNTGKKLLEQSIKTDSNNVELRFLRFTVQSSCPKALGYNKQLKKDKTFIVSHFDAVKSSDLKTKMSDYLIKSTALTEEEKKKIKSSAN